MSSKQTEMALDAAPVRVRVALDGAASEACHPEDCEHKAQKADGSLDAAITAGFDAKTHTKV